MFIALKRIRIRAVLLFVIGILLSAGQSRAQWPNGYTYSGTITLSHLKVPSADQVNFPVLVSGTYPALATTSNAGQVTNNNGYDIIFTSDPNGMTNLNFEREFYSPTGQVVFWVQLPVVSHTIDTVFYVFYGNSSVTTDQSKPVATWDSNYWGVYHLASGTTVNVGDSTSNGNNGTNQGATAVAGEIDGAANLNGNSQSITMGKVMDLGAGNLTLEAWVKPSNVNQYAPLLSKRQNTSNYQQYQMGIGAVSASGNGIAGKTIFAFFYDGTTLANAQSYHTANNVVDGNWHHVAVTRDSTNNVAIYVDGVSQTLVADIANTKPANTTNTGTFNIGYENGSAYVTSIIDEARISNSSRSSSWIGAEYNNQSAPSLFYSAVWGQTSSGVADPSLSVSQSSLSFTGTFRAANPAPQSVNISSSNSTPLSTWVAQANQPWITLSTSPSGGGTPGPLTGAGATTIYVQVNSSGQSVGTAGGSVSISATGASQSPQSVSVTSTVNAPPPWQNGYIYSGTIVVSHAQVSNSDQANFPVLVSGVYPALATTANGGLVTNSNGYDIIFTSDSDGLHNLNFERESYSPLTGQVAFWVQVPMISHTTDTVFYVFYGNASVTTDQSSPAGTWDSNYLGVYHLGNGTTLNVSDSTSHAYNGTNHGATAGTGEIDGAANLNGSSQSITMGTVMDLGAGNLTLEAWVKPSNASQFAPIIAKRQNSSNYQQYQIGIGSINSVGSGIAGKTVYAFFYDGTFLKNAQSYHTANNVVDGNWHHVVVTRDPIHNVAIYVDGISQTLVADIANTTPTNSTNSGAFNIGYDNGSTYLTSTVDEARVSNSSRSSDWVATEYSDENNPSTFYSVVWQSSGGIASGPALSLSQSSLNFTVTSGVGNQSPIQSVNISSSTTTGLGSWTAQSNQSWITLSTSSSGGGTSGPLTGSGAATIYIQVNSAGFAVSSTPYSGMVTFSSSGASQSPQNMPISLTVAPPPPVLSVSPSTLPLSATFGPNNPPVQSVSISSSNATALGNWTAQSNQAWITLSTSSSGGGTTGPLTGSGAATIYLQITSAGLAVSSIPYSGTVTVSSSSASQSPQTVAVSLTVNAPPSWPNGYTYSGTFTVSHLQVPNTDQVNFPVLVSGIFPALATTANNGQVTNPNGYDIIFTSDPDGLSRLNFERESYSPTTGQILYWVQLPLVSHTADTPFYVFYGNSSISTDQSSSAQTWDKNFLGVYHLPNGTSLNVNDSTANSNNGTNQGATAAAGEIGGGASLSGSSNFITMGNVLDIGSGDVTLEAWIKPSNVNQYAPILSKRQNTSNYQQYQMGVGKISNSGNGVAGKTIFAFFYDGTILPAAQSYHTVNNIVDGNWHHVVVTRDPTNNVSIYVDGVNQTLVADLPNKTAANTTNVGTFNIGYDNGSSYLNSIVDEARVSNISRSADWIATEYHNQASVATFESASTGQTFTGILPEPALSLSPGGLSFTATVNSTNPQPQSVSIGSLNSTPLGGWVAQSNQAWITLSTSPSGGGTSGPITGYGPATIYIQVNVAGFAVSSTPYSGGVTVTASGAFPYSQTLSVSLQITAPTSSTPSLSTSPTNIFLSAVSGSSNPVFQGVSISNNGGGVLNWTASPSDPWINLSSTTGTGGQNLGVGAAINGLGVGRYTGTLTITAPGASPGSQVINVTLAIVPPPSVSSGNQPPLYNGIVLPSQWPPVQGPSQAYQIPFYIANPPSPITIDVGRQLFVDDFLIQQTTMVRVQHQPVMYPGNPIIVPGGSPSYADTQNLAFPYSDGVWFDPNPGSSYQHFRMWLYCGYGNEVCYAESVDGKTWVRPQITGAPTNLIDQVAIIGGGRDSDVIWMDLQDRNQIVGCPTQNCFAKYKLFAYYPPANVIMSFSPDGISWYSQNSDIRSLQDRTTVFWNPFRSVWVDSIRQQLTVPASPYRAAYPSDRIRYYAESPDLSTWSPSDFTDSFWTMADENDPPYYPGGTYPELYNLDSVAYESVMVGLFSWYNPGPTEGSPSGSPGPDIVELGVGFSRDGFNWVRPTRGAGPSNAFIPASNIPGSWNEGNTQSAGGGFLVVGDELWFYFSGRSGTHSSAPGGSTGLAMLRRDGFYSMDAGASQATLTTRAIKFSGNNLFVNVNDPKGTLTITATNLNNSQMLTSNPVQTDSTLTKITWVGGSDLTSFEGQPVQFTFSLTNGEFYSFWVTNDSQGASHGYVGAGGPAFTTNVDTVGSSSIVPTTTQTLSIVPSSVSISAAAGATPPSEGVSVSDLGGTLSWTAVANQPWIVLSSPSGTGVQNLWIGASTQGLSAGTYSGLVTITAADANPSTQTISVSLTVTSQ